ncbi:MAG: glycosyltransferase family 39 protein [Actinobacteria bacterium]|nr:glycosyltransferase family 39 protein [Actinomycetota bacterium]
MRRPVAWLRARPVVVAALIAKVALTMPVIGRYGWHIDELYYAATARHLAWGYVDFPPITPWIARASVALWGDSLVGLRTLSLLAGLGVVVVVVLIVEELGGSRRAQALAAVTVLASSFFLGANILFQPVPFDQLASVLFLYAVTRLLVRQAPREWWWVGASFGLALETKYTIVAIAVGVFIGLIATPARSLLRGWMPWLAGILALAIAAPNLLWQATHHWPTREFIGHQNAEVRHDYTPLHYLWEMPIVVSPVVFVLCVVGFRRLWREPRIRALAIASAVVVLWYIVFGGKSYYPLTVFPVLMAAGVLEVADRALRPWLIALVVGAVIALVGTLPVLTERQMASSKIYKLREDYALELGWPALVRTVAGVYRALPTDERTDAIVYTANYGEAGAIDMWGHRYGLPKPVSGHNTYWFWRPPDRPDATVVAVGFSSSRLATWFTDCQVAAHIRDERGIANQEHGRTVQICRGRRPGVGVPFKHFQ